MNICILGWYGTETLGDRAILDGIVKIWNSVIHVNKIFIGSLYPFFTERTLFEDKEILRNDYSGEIKIFAENDRNELENSINECDIIMMGGGPLSDSKELYIIKAGFLFAKKRNKPTIIFGCGYGPFKNKAMHSVAKEIIRLSSLIILRDEISKKRVSNDVPGVQAVALEDPAIVSVLYYSERYQKIVQCEEITVNFRSFFPGMTMRSDFRIELFELLDTLSKSFNRIRLIPMHTFVHGGDDRNLYCEILCRGGYVPDNTYIQFIPQNLYQLYDTFSCSWGCIGMRYHSIVIQTILNGNNIILDYTPANKGKTFGFIQGLKNKEFYRDRYFNIIEDVIDSISCVDLLKKNERYKYDNRTDQILEQYSKILKV